MRRAALEALGTTTTAATASAVQPVLTPKAAYKASYKAATRAHADGATLATARSAALEEYKVAPCIETIRTCENPGASPPKRGRKPPMGVDAEKFLARAVRACAARKIPLFKDGIISGAGAIVESHPWMKLHFGKEGPGDKWYYRWLNEYNLEGAHIRPIETKPLAIAAYNKFIQTVSAQPLAIEVTSNN